ncbi:MAG: hypothetical protein H6Q17_220 [Bacteroidetes bacterium]|nr:hypothetical protein [Bacteroidota bacterium]
MGIHAGVIRSWASPHGRIRTAAGMLNNTLITHIRMNNNRISQRTEGLLLVAISWMGLLLIGKGHFLSSLSRILYITIVSCYFFYFWLLKKDIPFRMLIQKYKRLTLATFGLLWITTSALNIANLHADWQRVIVHGFFVSFILIVSPSTLIAIKYRISPKNLITNKEDNT